MAKTPKSGTSSFLLAGPRIADKLFQYGDVPVKSRIENKFSVKLSKESVIEDIEIQPGEQSDQYTKRVREAKGIDVTPRRQPILKKVTKTRVIVNGGSAANRDKAEKALIELQSELMRREEGRLNELLNSPRKLDHSKQAIKLSDTTLQASVDFLSALVQNKDLASKASLDNVSKTMSLEAKEIQQRKNSRSNDDIKIVKEKLRRFIKIDLKKLNENQATDALTSKLSDLESALTNLNLKEFKIDSTIIAINGHIQAIKTDAAERLEKEKNLKNVLYKKLPDDERAHLLLQIQMALESKNISTEAMDLESYAKTALFKMDKITLMPGQIDRIIQTVDVAIDQSTIKDESLSRKEEDPFRASHDKNRQEFSSSVLVLNKKDRNWDFVPNSESQVRQIENMRQGGLSLVAGPAGTGKTSVAVAFALSQLEAGKTGRIIITSPMTEIGDKKSMGYLPGNEMQKMAPHIRQILRSLIKFGGKDKIKSLMGLSETPQPEYSRSPLLDDMLNDNALQIMPLANIRGLDIPDATIIVDEAQNLTTEDAKALTTRAGHNTQMVFCGDPEQTDLTGFDSRGLPIRDFNKQPCFDMLLRNAHLNPMVTVTTYKENDIVRSPLTRANVEWFRAMQTNFEEMGGMPNTFRSQLGSNGRDMTLSPSDRKLTEAWSQNDNFYAEKGNLPERPDLLDRKIKGMTIQNRVVTI